ncbi:MAG: hypothetical protein AB1589_25195 [Cyanobacteriota bacterium]
MSELEQKNWHQKTWVRVLVLLLIPLIIGGLYWISTWLTVAKPRAVPITPETSNPER